MVGDGGVGPGGHGGGGDGGGGLREVLVAEVRHDEGVHLPQQLRLLHRRVHLGPDLPPLRPPVGWKGRGTTEMGVEVDSSSAASEQMCSVFSQRSEPPDEGENTLSASGQWKQS